METFATIERESGRRGLEYLVIGGLAVNFYGYSRDTADLDLLICRDARDAWAQLLRDLGYALERDAETFLQFAPPVEGSWPVDLMVVQQTTFSPMLAASQGVEMYGTRVKIPALEHLLALKLHALKHTRPHRFIKDFQDVEGLVLVNRLDLHSDRVREMFLKYGNADLYEKVIRACSKS